MRLEVGVGETRFGKIVGKGEAACWIKLLLMVVTAIEARLANVIGMIRRTEIIAGMNLIQV
ncbi:MAG: hypothetical protein HYT19_00205 [Candidatus Nealsonbacteria bacterium]|nr:hypothetical protein [Candidatus Nealsonbacteria bacterium]